MTAEKKQTFDMLLSPMNIGKLTVKNRTVMTAAEMGMGDMDGKPTEKLMSYYEERAKGGVGLIITATTRVNDWYAASTFTQLAMSHDYHIAPMHEFAQRIHRHGAKLAVQLHHAGRQGYCTPINNLPFLLPMVHAIPKMRDLVFKMTGPLYAMEQRDLLMAVQAPSKGERSYHTPSKMRAMTTREVKRLIQDFINAAVRCQKAGVDAVELHAAHGYIIEQFLSPNTNKRTDEYGGSLENRMRMLLEIIAGIRERCGDYPIIVRLTVDEMYDRIGKPGKGYTLEEGKLMAKRLEEAGIDAINVTSACYDTYNYWLEPTSFEPGWRAYLAKEIKNTVSIPVIAANFMRSPAQAERQLEEGVQDFIGSARSFFVDPYWVQKVESGHPELVRRCIGCLYCMNSMTDAAFKGTNGQCALNPYLGREYLPAPKRDGGGRLAVVVGAGPAGLTAAETLARRGFAVRIFEKEEKAGGQVKTASSCIKKDRLYWCIEDLTANLRTLGVEVEYGVTVTAQMINDLDPYAVIVSTGGLPIRPAGIPGADGDNVSLAPEIILGQKKIEGKNVVVVGSGMTGLETTEVLNECGNHTTVIEMADEIAPGTWFQLLDDEMSRINGHGTEFLTGKRLLAIKDGKVLVEDVKTSELEEIKADEVVLSMGVRSDNALYRQLYNGRSRVYAVGDARQSGQIAHAVHDAFDTVCSIG